MTSLARPVAIFRALLRAGFLEAVAYRAEIFVWVLATTMPLVMMALFGTVASEGPIGRYRSPEIIAYFLCTFIVRQLTGSWISWQINFEVRDGTLGTRLLRPVHPVFGYVADSFASIPMRLVVATPVFAILLVTSGAHALTRDPATWLLVLASLVGAWALALGVALAIGALSLYIESSTKVMDVWLAFFFVFSGYLVPIDLFPRSVQRALDFLPFRYQIGLSVELMTGAHDRARGLALVTQQWAFVAIAMIAAWALWRRGLARYASFGG